MRTSEGEKEVERERERKRGRIKGAGVATHNAISRESNGSRYETRGSD